MLVCALKQRQHLAESVDGLMHSLVWYSLPLFVRDMSESKCTSALTGREIFFPQS